ncbi:unnamed protein product [Triticum turgidum subsp. durum]|uniref:Uncharacterized protein n=1 Tax=Triticum turgidum subsp. durum TaxID=4567 RepID=A0A9R1R651_TRITD|nr:unnamed protein product [Triticum turgidum subsp. durum]
MDARGPVVLHLHTLLAHADLAAAHPEPFCRASFWVGQNENAKYRRRRPMYNYCRQDPVNVYTTTTEYLFGSTTTIAWIRQDRGVNEQVLLRGRIVSRIFAKSPLR